MAPDGVKLIIIVDFSFMERKLVARFLLPLASEVSMATSYRLLRQTFFKYFNLKRFTTVLKRVMNIMML